MLLLPASVGILLCPDLSTRNRITVVMRQRYISRYRLLPPENSTFYTNMMKAPTFLDSYRPLLAQSMARDVAPSSTGLRGPRGRGYSTGSSVPTPHASRTLSAQERRWNILGIPAGLKLQIAIILYCPQD
jgi:hypothetical protein